MPSSARRSSCLPSALAPKVRVRRLSSRAFILAAFSARGDNRERIRKPRGEREAWSVLRARADVRTRVGWVGRVPPGSPSRTRPPARRSWSLAPRLRRQPASDKPGLRRLKCVRTDPGFSPGRARPPPGCRAARPCRAGDREAEDPETPTCEAGLSAASARPGVAAVPSHRSSASASAPSRRRLDQKAMPPRFRTPPEAPLAGRTIQLIVLVGIFVKQLFPHVSPENM